MNQFEYISVAVSLVLALGITRLLEGLPIIFQGNRRYWVHWLWCLVVGINFAIMWWIFWNYRNVADWNLGKFLMVLLYPALGFVVASVLMPKEAKKDTDWRAYFYGIRKSFFALLTLSTIAQAVVILVVAGVPMFSPPIYTISPFILLYALGIFIDNPRAQASFAVLNALMFAFLLSPMAYRSF
ncbi:MAG: hypothetical protein HKN85_12110 [Gammaproteobacteria bacterium]|nr:hypothetical protein [Gammaproteobacteria bacterium]